MKRFLILGLLSIAIVGKAQTDKNFTITGSVKTSIPGKKIYLELANSQPLMVVDSTEVGPDRKFKFNPRPELDEGSVYQVNVFGVQRAVVLIEGGEKIEIAAEGVEQGAISVNGSKVNNDYQQLMNMNKVMEEKVRKWQEQFAEADKKKDTKKTAQIQIDFEQASQQFTKEIKALIPGMGATMATLMATNFLNPESEMETILEVAKKFEKERPNMKQGQVFSRNVKRLRGIREGDEAPEINLKDPNDKVVTLSSLRGKVVLIDFWASWCGPCRQENPNVVKAYSKFKAKGFEIYSVSLDKDKAPWLAAIAKDGLTWTHVSDLKYWQSEAAQIYGVSGIPATFLLDKDGKVIAKNLRGEALDRKLEEILK